MLKIKVVVLFIVIISCSVLFGVNNALDFGGSTSASVNCGTGALLQTQGNFTLEAWIKPAAAGFSSINSIMGNNTAGNSGNGAVLYVNDWGGSSMNLVLESRSNKARSVAAAVTAGVWQHVAVSWDGTFVNFYVNGAQVTTLNHGYMQTVPAEPFRIGAMGGEYWGFNGQIDDVRVWNVARTITEVADNYAISLVGTETGLVAYYHLDEGTGTNVADATPNGLDGVFGSSLPTWVESTISMGTEEADIPLDNNDPYEVPAALMEITFPQEHPDINLEVVLNEVAPNVVNELPATVTSLLPVSWVITTTEGQGHDYVLSFDLATVTGYEVGTLYRILKRANDTLEWVDVEDLGGVLSYEGSKVTITGLNSFSEFTPGLPTEETLPVELSTFQAVQTSDNYAQINWTTASESNLVGYQLYRNETEELASAFTLNSILIGATNTNTGHNYSYTDDETTTGNTYYYWIKSLEFDNTFEFFGPVQVKINASNDDSGVEGVELAGTSIQSNYPNPFNPETTINFFVDEDDEALVSIYNLKGELVKSYNVFASGNHKLTWHGLDNRGNSVSSGIYLFNLSSKQTNQSRKLTLSK